MAITDHQNAALTEGRDPDLRRTHPLRLHWDADGLSGRITIDGEIWAYVEWSEKRQAWCTEDAAGRCLRHAADERGRAASKKEAVALATAIIRDGRLPPPEARTAAPGARKARPATRPEAAIASTQIAR